jgi:hypothetical protein
MPQQTKARKARTAGKRHPLNMRTTKEIRDRLERAAATAGRSLAQEVEHRLDRSFVDDGGFGSLELKRFAVLMAVAFDTAGSLHAPQGAQIQEWIRNPDCYRAAMFGVIEALLIGMPEATPDDVILQFESLKGRLMSRFLNQRTA